MLAALFLAAGVWIISYSCTADTGNLSLYPRYCRTSCIVTDVCYRFARALPGGFLHCTRWRPAASRRKMAAERKRHAATPPPVRCARHFDSKARCSAATPMFVVWRRSRRTRLPSLAPAAFIAGRTLGKRRASAAIARQALLEKTIVGWKGQIGGNL